MKTCFISARALLTATLLAFCASPINAATDAKSDSLNNAQDELATLKNKYTDTHPRVIEQNQRIAQLQRRIDEEKPAPTSRSQIIRTEVRILVEKNGGVELIAAPTLVTQSGQEASLFVGAFGLVLNSSVDEQNNITTSLELSVNSTDGKPAEKAKLPLIKSRPGERNVVPVPGGTLLEILATLVEPKGITVDFPGGSLAQLLIAINKSSSQPFNLIASQDALALAIPQVSVRNVAPRELALALDQILVGYVVDFSPEKPGQDSQPVFTIRSNKIDQANSAKPETPQSERFVSYPMGAYLQDRIQVSDVIEAINSAWLLDSSHRPEGLKIKYHAATGILMVSSHEQAGLDIANNVLANLAQQAEYLRTNPPRKP